MKWFYFREDRYLPAPVYPHPLPVMVTSVGEAELDERLPYERALSDVLAAELVLEGEMLLLQAGRRSRIPAGDVFVLKTGVPHHYVPAPGSFVRKLYIQFDGTLAHQLVPRLTDHVRPTDSAETRAIFQRIIRTSKVRRSGCERRLSALGYELLTGLLLDCLEHGSTDARLPRQVERALRFMSGALDQPLAMAQVADAAGVSSSHLHLLFRKHLGQAPLAWFRKQKIAYAKQLLSSGEVSCKSVALELGFRDPLYFSVFFKRETGLSPQHWRRAARSG